MEISIRFGALILTCMLGSIADAHSFGEMASTLGPSHDSVAEGMVATLSAAAGKYGVSPERVPYLQAVTLSNLIWTFPQGQPHVLKVCFGPSGNYTPQGSAVGQPWGIDTDFGKQIANAVIQIAPEWLQNTDLSIDFGPAGNPYRCPDQPGAETLYQIRVWVDYTVTPTTYGSLVGNNSAWENIGNQSGTQGFTQPYSMVLSFHPFNVDFTDQSRRRYFILHEFGHALGFLHEMQRMQCKWNYAALVPAYFSSVPDAQAQVAYISNFANAYPAPNGAAGKLIQTAINVHSIMGYDFESSAVFLDGENDVCYTKTLTNSLTVYDRQGFADVYGKQSAPTLAAATTFAVQGAETLSKLDIEAPQVASLLRDPRVAPSAEGAFVELKKRASPRVVQKVRNAITLTQNEQLAVRAALNYRAGRIAAYPATVNAKPAVPASQ
ncbi:hypothetical protein P3T42_007363 [Paraburkholderia sp. GAS38]|uniref:hypothetical protein n=1 Tax=Paraburkholderia sp. GAS38 TaxID=3035133 RepID=UPI003D1F603D